VNLRVRLQMVECLEYNLHELILSGYELLYLRVVVGLAVACLTVAWIVPCVHHLRYFDERDISNLNYMLDFFINLYLRDEVTGKVPKHPTSHIENSQAR
jgi:hypothetical protein